MSWLITGLRNPATQRIHPNSSYDGHGQWLMISGAITENDVQEIHVYDSMYPTVGTYTKKDIAPTVSASEKNVELKMMNVH